MKRLAVAVVLLVLCASASAGEKPTRPPIGFGRSGYGVRITYSGPGYVKHRYTYPGYSAGFPPPAMYYYGYPQSGYSYGVGF